MSQICRIVTIALDDWFGIQVKSKGQDRWNLTKGYASEINNRSYSWIGKHNYLMWWDGAKKEKGIILLVIMGEF